MIITTYKCLCLPCLSCVGSAHQWQKKLCLIPGCVVRGDKTMASVFVLYRQFVAFIESYCAAYFTCAVYSSFCHLCGSWPMK